MSLSNGRLGVEFSSMEKLHQISSPASIVQPIMPISDVVLSPANTINFVGSQCLSTALKDPGGRVPGTVKYGVFSFTAVSAFVFGSKEIMM